MKSLAKLSVLLCLVVGTLAACTHNQQQDDPSELGDRPVGTAPITAEEIVSSGLLGSTAYDVVQRLRPTFLIDRTAIRRSSQPISVSINGGQPTATGVLNTTPASTVQEIRYLTAGQAAVRYGQRAAGPVILVTLRTQQQP
jgi:hypothetical protein